MTPSASSARARPKASPTCLVLARPPAPGAERLVDVSPGGGDEAAAPQRRARAPSARPSRAAPRLPDVEDSHRVVDPAELEQRLDVVGASTRGGRLAPPECARRLSAWPSQSRRAASPLQSATSPRTARCKGGWSPNCSSGELEGSLRRLPRELELAAMDGDPRDGKKVLRHLEPVLDRDVVRARGVVGRELPAPAQSSTHARYQSARAPRLVALAATLVRALQQMAPRPRRS